MMGYVRKYGMFVVLIAATLLVSYLVYADIKVADIGIEVSKGSDNTWIVKKIESNGLAYQQGIRQGDRVISIDHVNVEIYPNLRLLSTVHSMVTERAGVRMEYSFPTSNLPISMDQTVLPLCLYFLLLSLSLFLLIKKERMQQRTCSFSFF
ncbi:hypothetical protein BVG16_19765 [Paenibacillus selenitireducens]|uniref:PDZ domain-containing protein n=1 Tax=Paenibacillus selenitireducens TaxID=1324314 RepID=A0A1T2X6W6_9BACL|nr:PDZ domain-containing protein [Paenibacillus selenitireducens]OPA75582.1 hypothetical protein BVG16_19765 [Paenibacillus selenitireducens]